MHSAIYTTVSAMACLPSLSPIPLAIQNAIEKPFSDLEIFKGCFKIYTLDGIIMVCKI